MIDLSKETTCEHEYEDRDIVHGEMVSISRGRGDDMIGCEIFMTPRSCTKVCVKCGHAVKQSGRSYYDTLYSRSWYEDDN